MDSDSIWRHIDTQRTILADVLETLPDEAWRTPSLCAAWTVRDVAAHLALSHARLRDMVRPAIKSGFRYNAMVRDAAVHSPLIDPPRARPAQRRSSTRSSRSGSSSRTASCRRSCSRGTPCRGSSASMT